MKYPKTRLLFCILTSCALLASAVFTGAQTTNKPPAQKHSGTPADETDKPAKGHPFHGKLAAVDKAAKTITVGKTTYQVTSETRLRKSGKPATLDDAVIGEIVSGYVKPANGKMVASTINLGPKETTGGAGEGRRKPGNKEQP